MERTFAWLCQNRRFSRDYERLCSTSEALIYATMGRLMLHRLARKCGFQTVFSSGRDRLEARPERGPHSALWLTGNGGDLFLFFSRTFLTHAATPLRYATRSVSRSEDLTAVYKLRTNRPLTGLDLEALEQVLIENGLGTSDDLEKAKLDCQGLGLFVRSLIGLDRQAAKDALAGFIDQKTLSATQIEFIDLIVNHLTDHGVMPAAALYESPFTDVAPHGPEGLFGSGGTDELVAVLDQVTASARAA